METGPTPVWRRRIGGVTLVGVLAALGILTLLGGSGAVACLLVLDCHIRASPPLRLENQVSTGHGATVLPTGFRQTTVLHGLVFPTDFAFLPDGRIVVSEKNGLIRIGDQGRMLKRPLLDLRARVNTNSYRGIMTVEPDPDYPRRPYLYVVYVNAGNPPNTRNTTTVRMSRFTVHGNAADPRSEKVLLGRISDVAACEQEPRRDCILSWGDHDGADIAFAKDGTMFVSIGDGGLLKHYAKVATYVQSLSTLGGKILHVTREGQGIPSNPFWDGDPNANRSKVWALGFRSPFRVSLTPDGRELLVGDVGYQTWEEIDRVRRGGNYGWPCYEGPMLVKGSAKTDVCSRLLSRRSTFSRPFVALRHPGSASITGGAVYTGTSYPDAYRDSYFYGDWAYSWIRTTSLASGVPRSRQFAKPAAGPVAFRAGPPNGDMYYLALNAGELRRLTYVGAAAG
jgi:glucose/arabinose dehydrogenase